MSNRKLIIVAVSLALVFGFGRTTTAQVLFQDDFESDIAGTAPTTDDLDPANWTIVGGGPPEATQVLNNDPPGSEDPAGSNQYLHLARTTGLSGFNSQEWAWAEGWNPALTDNQVVQMSFRFYRPASDRTLIAAWGDDNPPWTTFQTSFNVYIGANFDDGHRFVGYYGEGAIHELPELTFEDDAWQNLTITADMAAQSYSIEIEDNSVSGIPFQTAGITKVQSIGAGNNNPAKEGGDAAHYAIDNFRFQVGGEIPPIPGDANRDGKVTDADAAILASHWQMQPDATWEDGDFNDDGKVTDADAAILASHWQEGVAEGAAAVPEPASVVLIGGALLFMVLRGLRLCRL